MGRRTIKEALSLAQPGDQVLILPGKYQEHVDIKKSVELIGYGRREDIVLEAAGGALFRGGIIVSTGQHAKVTNLTVRQQKFVGPGAISIEAGELEVSQCDLTTSNGAGVVCKKASVILRGTRIHDCPMQGLVVEGASATALVEESTISACCRTSGAAIYLKAGGKITMRRTRITDNFRFAIQIEAGGGGTFEDNDLRGNQKGVWETDPSGFEVVQARNLE
jgi:nitrous oxidase accessory protein NosD